MATQVAVPMIVATTVEIRAMISVLAKALMISESEARFKYQSKVKPPHFALDLLELQERIIIVTMGRYIKTRIMPMYTFSIVFLI